MTRLRSLSVILCVGALLASSLAWAQLSYRGDLETTLDATFDPLVSPNAPDRTSFGVTLALHLEADYTLGPVDFVGIFDPSVRSDGGEMLQANAGLGELYAVTSLGDLDLSVGAERLVLEYARLTLPLSLEPNDRRGNRRGVLGVRALYYPGDWRLRGALYYGVPSGNLNLRTIDDTARLVPVLSARRNFGAFELEAHALYPGRVVVGLGGSGLVGDLVVYGEGWLLTGDLEARGALGVTGYLGDIFWSAEAAYGPTPLSPTNHPQLAAQFSIPRGVDASVELNGSLGLAANDIVAGLGASVSQNIDRSRDLTLSVSGQRSASATLIGLRLSFRGFF